VPPTSEEYTRHWLPWFEYYDESAAAMPASEELNTLKPVAQLGKEKSDVPLPENESVAPTNFIKIRKGLKRGHVREGSF
jgi:hypothetical protein